MISYYRLITWSIGLTVSSIPGGNLFRLLFTSRTTKILKIFKYDIIGLVLWGYLDYILDVLKFLHLTTELQTQTSWHPPVLAILCSSTTMSTNQNQVLFCVNQSETSISTLSHLIIDQTSLAHCELSQSVFITVLQSFLNQVHLCLFLRTMSLWWWLLLWWMFLSVVSPSCFWFRICFIIFIAWRMENISQSEASIVLNEPIRRKFYLHCLMMNCWTWNNWLRRVTVILDFQY